MNPFDIFLVFQHPLHWLIVNLTEATKSYGVAIILFTIIIRTVLAPLYVIQMRSSKKMVELSPKIKDLQRKYGKDRETLTRETMALYREHNHNPALGCLLPLIQLPILWSLFLVLRSLPDKGLAHPALYQAHFLWLSLGKPDPYHILPIVAGITQWIQQRMMLQPTSDPQQRQMNQIMQFLPLTIVAFAWAYPSGLAVYWVTSNIMMMILQFFISGWGQLFTPPFSIPPAPGGVVARPAEPQQSLFASLFAPRQQEPEPEPERPQRSRVRSPRNTAEESAPGPDADGSSARSGKMERYAAKHSRNASRGRPSARGAKK